MTSPDDSATRNSVEELMKVLDAPRISCAAKTMLQWGFQPDNSPQVMVFPETTEEIQAIVGYAKRKNIPLIPVGGSTAISRVLGPCRESIAVCLHGMDRILEVNLDNLSATVEAGVTNSRLNTLLAEHNLLLPVHPDFAESTIGGEVAAAHSSLKRFKYGSLVDYLLGASWVTPSGQVVSTGGRTVKNVSGYDLTRLIGGSWGTMGIITSVTLKLIARPEKAICLHCRFSSAEEALQAGVRTVRVARRSLDSLHITNTVTTENDDQKDCGPFSLFLFLSGRKEATDLSREKIGALLTSHQIHKSYLDQSDLNPVGQMRASIRRGPHCTISVDKRTIAGLASLLCVMQEADVSYDLDVSSGLLDFTIPELLPDNWSRLLQMVDNLTAQPAGTGKSPFSPPRNDSLVTSRVKAAIDPHNLLFPANTMLQRVRP